MSRILNTIFHKKKLRTGSVGTVVVVGIFFFAIFAQHGVPASTASQLGQQSPYAARRMYIGHKVIQVHIRDTADLELVRAMTDDIWSRHDLEGTIDIRISPEQFSRLLQTDLSFTTLIEDLQERVDSEAAEIVAREKMPHLSWYENYKQLNEIQAKISELADEFSNLAQLTEIGRSIEDRPVLLLEITGTGDSSDRPIVMIIGCQHAREWVSPMTVMYIAEQLLEQYTASSKVRDILDQVQFFIVPMMNPDGYLYTWTTERYWRKNRNPNPDFECMGVDLNRNWNYSWGSAGADYEPCEDGENNTYRGTAPFSEPELHGVRDVALTYRDRIQAFIDFHSYKQLILSPWSYTNEPPPSLGLFNVLGENMANAIADVHGKTYVYGPGATTAYIVSGGAKDWGFGELCALSWTIELRPRLSTEGGFSLPPDQIQPTAEESFEAVISLTEALMPPEMAWVDFSWTESEAGTYSQPYDMVSEGVSAVHAKGTVMIKAGTSEEALVITEPVTLRSYKGSAVIGRSGLRLSGMDSPTQSE
ncbi:MAG: hypothetical protein JSV84_00020 [Gemmatimonadota bacterium]|nr:MAG: hypothetical protein JSV84_00020 [Gemmatimonadota bacterium]